MTGLAVLCFATSSHERHVFLKQVIEYKVFVLIFAATLSEAFLILRRIRRRDIVTNVRRPSYKVPIIRFRFLKKSDFSLQIFEKTSDIKVHENPSTLNRVVPCGKTDRQTLRS